MLLKRLCLNVKIGGGHFFYMEVSWQFNDPWFSGSRNRIEKAAKGHCNPNIPQLYIKCA